MPLLHKPSVEQDAQSGGRSSYSIGGPPFEKPLYTPTKEIDRRSLQEFLEMRRSLLSVAELAELLNMAERTVYAAVKKGKIPSLRLLGSVRLDPKAIARWLDSCSITTSLY